MLGHAANFLYMLTGERPSGLATRAFDVALILHADHELNASTFAARVAAATLTDIHSAIVGAIGALKGPLHGGANADVMRLLLEIGKDGPAEKAEEVVRAKLARKEKIPGFGHRVYHTEDPRATHLRQMSRDLGQRAGEPQWFEMSQRIEALVKAEKKLNPNVDFYSASTYHALGITIDLFTPIFAVSRVSGWTAHVLEQYANNRLIRPRAEYIGPEYPQRYMPLERARSVDPQHIRNFSVIAHIDHGKSTLADRFLEITGALQAREMEAQVLDAMDLERERGITIKAHPVCLHYTAQDGEKYVLNLIDTPGHVDFSYEVTRSLAACEGALLLVDASQGVEAQTLANAYLAVENNLEIIPVINKIDLPERAAGRGAPPDHGHHRPRRRPRAAGQRQGGHRRAGDPRGDRRAPAAAGRRSRRAAQGADLRLLVRPLPRRRHRRPRDRRRAAPGHEDPADGGRAGLRVAAGRHLHAEGDAGRRARRRRGRLPRREHQEDQRREDRRHDHRGRRGRRSSRSPASSRSSRWCSPGFYPVEGHQYPELRDALEKLRLNDASFFYEPETSAALGFGFRCGFLGLLHMEIVQERLEREFDMDLVTTAPGVLYRVTHDRRRSCRRSTARRSCPTPG